MREGWEPRDPQEALQERVGGDAAVPAVEMVEQETETRLGKSLKISLRDSM